MTKLTPEQIWDQIGEGGAEIMDNVAPIQFRVSWPALAIGDEVTIKGTIVGLNGSHVRILDDDGDVTAFPISRIVSHLPAPKPLKAGDHVLDHFPGERVNEMGGEGQIVSIIDAHAWVKWKNLAAPTTELLAMLRRKP